MEIPFDVVQNHLLPFCDVKTILTLETACKEFECQVWKKVLFRDFNVELEFHKRYLTNQRCHDIYRLCLERKSGKNIWIQSNEMSTLSFGFKRTDSGVAAIIKVPLKYQYPIAEEFLHGWYTHGKMDLKCSSHSRCRCFDCSLTFLRQFTME